MCLSDVAVLLIFYRINNCVGQDNLWAFLTLLFFAFSMSFLTFLVDILYFFVYPDCKACDKVGYKNTTMGNMQQCMVTMGNLPLLEKRTGYNSLRVMGIVTHLLHVFLQFSQHHS